MVTSRRPLHQRLVYSFRKRRRPVRISRIRLRSNHRASRDALVSIGGFAAIADQLANDYRLGELTRSQGLRTVLSDCVVQTPVSEPTLLSLIRHKLRWLRTIRAVRPLGYTLAFVSFSVPVNLACVLLTAFSTASICMFGLALVARTLLHREVHRTSLSPFSVALTLLSDFSLPLSGFGLFMQHVQWRDVRYKITSDGAVEARSSLACGARETDHSHATPAQRTPSR